MHRKTRVIPWGEIVTGFILFVVATMILVALSWLGTPAGASTVPPWQAGGADDQTCALFWAWSAHPTSEHFEALTAEARHADTYLRQDVRALAHAEHVHNVQAVQLNIGGVALDCTLTGDE